MFLENAMKKRLKRPLAFKFRVSSLIETGECGHPLQDKASVKMSSVHFFQFIEEKQNMTKTKIRQKSRSGSLIQARAAVICVNPH